MRNAVAVALLAVLLFAVNAAGKEPAKAKDPAMDKASQDTVVARVDGKEIHLSALDYDYQKRYDYELHQLKIKLYQEEKTKLNEQIDRMLLEKEAAKRKITSEELIASITAEPKGGKEEEKADREKAYQDFLDNMKKNYPGFSAMPEDRKLEALKNAVGIQGDVKGPLKDEIINKITMMNKMSQTQVRRNEFLKGLREKADIKILLARPELIRLDVASDDDPFMGKDDAKITLIEFADYQCPFCSKIRPVLNELLAKEGDKIRFVFRDLPLPSHQNAKAAAEAAECADEQGRFWEYHDMLFDNQGTLDSESLKGYAKTIGLNLEEFTQCLESGSQRAEVERDAENARLAGITSTPSILVNGYYITGNPTLAYLEEVIGDLEKGQVPRVQEDAGKG